MSFESCSTAHLDCAVRVKLSDDGLHWGELGGLGMRPQTATGRYFRHAPTLAWTAAAGHPQGLIALIGQSVADDPSVGATAAGAANDGRVLFVNDRGDASGEWRMAHAAGAHRPCQRGTRA